MLETSSLYKNHINLSKLDFRYGMTLRNYFINSRDPDFESSFLFEKFVDLIGKCLIYDPSQRITAPEALNHPFFNSKIAEKVTDVPWPSLPYTKVFLSFKNNSKPKILTKFLKNYSISQDNSRNSKHSTNISRNSPRVLSSDEETIHNDRPASYVDSKPLKVPMQNITPKY